MIIGQIVKFPSSGTFLCGDEGWKHTESEGPRFIPSLQRSFRVLLEAYVWPDGSGPLFLSNWPSLLDRDRIQLAHFLEFNAEHEILPVIREAWMSEYQFLLSSGEGGVGNDYWTLRKAFVVAERLGRLAIHIGESPAPKLRASLEEAEAHFNLLAGSIIRRSAPHSKLLKLMPTTGPSS